MGRPKKFDPEAAVGQAAATFRAHGYTDTSPQALADGMNIGKGSLYNTFGSKYALFLTSLEHYCVVSLDELKQVMEGSGPIRDRVRCLLMSFVDADLADPERRGCLAVNTTLELRGEESAVAEVLDRSYRATESVLRTAFVEAQAAGQLVSGRDPTALAGLVQSTMIGLRVLVKTTDDRARLESVVEAVVASI